MFPNQLPDRLHDNLGSCVIFLHSTPVVAACVCRECEAGTNLGNLCSLDRTWHWRSVCPHQHSHNIALLTLPSQYCPSTLHSTTSILTLYTTHHHHNISPILYTTQHHHNITPVHYVTQHNFNIAPLYTPHYTTPPQCCPSTQQHKIDIWYVDCNLVEIQGLLYVYTQVNIVMVAFIILAV